MNVEIKEQMYEGKAKQVFATSDPEIVMVHYKDDATAGDGEKKGTIRDKGRFGKGSGGFRRTVGGKNVRLKRYIEIFQHRALIF